MAVTLTKIFPPVQLPGAAAGVLFTFATAGGTLKNLRVRLTNTSGAAVPATLYADVAANSSSAANCCLSAKSIAANDYLDIDIPTMVTGDTLRGFAGTANVITMHEIGGTIVT